MKRIFALVLSFAVLFSCLVLPAGAMFDPTPVYQVQAQSAYIVNTDTNIIVYDKDSTKQVSAGGLTKYMTIALLLTNYADQLDNTFTMPFALSSTAALTAVVDSLISSMAFCNSPAALVNSSIMEFISPASLL